MTATAVWQYLDNAKREAVQLGFTAEQKQNLWHECADLFRQVTGSLTCPAWWIGGWTKLAEAPPKVPEGWWSC